jgi:DNA mismatch repair protein MutL
MAQIQVLAPDVVNKIAAGEVIERPASAVKELVENALDAGASEIRVDIEEGGRSFFRVTDNGHGIAPTSFLAFAPHATSKLATAMISSASPRTGFEGGHGVGRFRLQVRLLEPRRRGGAESSKNGVRGR